MIYISFFFYFASDILLGFYWSLSLLAECFSWKDSEGFFLNHVRCLISFHALIPSGRKSAAQFTASAAFAWFGTLVGSLSITCIKNELGIQIRFKLLSSRLFGTNCVQLLWNHTVSATARTAPRMVRRTASLTSRLCLFSRVLS